MLFLPRWLSAGRKKDVAAGYEPLQEIAFASRRWLSGGQVLEYPRKQRHNLYLSKKVINDR
jgi:hypothetical protein